LITPGLDSKFIKFNPDILTFSWHTIDQSKVGEYEIVLVGTINKYSVELKIHLTVTSIFLYNPNPPILPKADDKVGKIVDPLLLSAYELDLGVPYDADGDSIITELRVEPKSSAFKFIDETGKLQFNLIDLLKLSAQAGETKYYLNIIKLTDATDYPQSNSYSFLVMIPLLTEEQIINFDHFYGFGTFTATDLHIVPKFTEMKISNTGLVLIKFSEKLFN
jgi:hypothetical protein